MIAGYTLFKGIGNNYHSVCKVLYSVSNLSKTAVMGSVICQDFRLLQTISSYYTLPAYRYSTV
jgi:hypothetical protein